MKPWKLSELSDDLKRRIALHHNIAVPPANVEQIAGDKQVAKKENTRLDSPCGFVLSILSRRRRLPDCDGISAKACIDGIVGAGILEDDRQKIIRDIEFRYEQNKQEETVVSIYEAMDDV